MKKLNKQYESICNKFVDMFCTKQEIEFDGWVGDEVGGIASFSCQYFFNLSDIILDLNSNQPKGNILNWQDDGIEFKQQINYKSYTMGLRYEHLKKEVQQEQLDIPVVTPNVIRKGFVQVIGGDELL